MYRYTDWKIFDILKLKNSYVGGKHRIDINISKRLWADSLRLNHTLLTAIRREPMSDKLEIR